MLELLGSPAPGLRTPCELFPVQPAALHRPAFKAHPAAFASTAKENGQKFFHGESLFGSVCYEAGQSS